jgi:hypothetical protein
MLLAGCSTNKPKYYPSDPHNECVYPKKPAEPITVTKAAIYILDQRATIGKCRALLHPGGDP